MVPTRWSLNSLPATPNFPYGFTDYHLSIYPSTDGKIEWEKGIGAGPYILKSYEPGVKLVGERNPNFFKDTWFDGIEMLTIADIAARTNAYLSGEVHFIDRADLKTIDMLKSAPNTEIYNQSGPTHYTAPMHHRRGALRQSRRAQGHQIRHQPPGTGGQDAVWLWQARQRQPDLGCQ